MRSAKMEHAIRWGLAVIAAGVIGIGCGGEDPDHLVIDTTGTLTAPERALAQPEATIREEPTERCNELSDVAAAEPDSPPDPIPAVPRGGPGRNISIGSRIPGHCVVTAER